MCPILTAVPFDPILLYINSSMYRLKTQLFKKAAKYFILCFSLYVKAGDSIKNKEQSMKTSYPSKLNFPENS
jgi:hypothetical protein